MDFTLNEFWMILRQQSQTCSLLLACGLLCLLFEPDFQIVTIICGNSSVKNKKYVCRKSGCLKEPYLGGLCRTHHDEDEAQRQLHADALIALHSGAIDGGLPGDRVLADELDRLRDYWSRVCSVLHSQQGARTMPLDEAKYATEWCISLAQEIVKAQRQVAAGKTISISLESTQRWVWERLQNLDAGLRSNGTRRE